MKSDYNFLVTKNRNKWVNVTGWQTRVFLPTGLFIAKPERQNMTFLTVERVRSVRIHSVLAKGKVRRVERQGNSDRVML